MMEPANLNQNLLHLGWFCLVPVQQNHSRSDLSINRGWYIFPVQSQIVKTVDSGVPEATYSHVT